MIKNVDVSVIVPAYNCEEYLDDLFACLLNQTLKNIEIIVVDNASEDNTVSKVRQYSEKYPEIKLLSQPSAGAGLARNTGIENANGKYVAFLDADDLYDKTMLEKLFFRMEKDGADIGVCSVCKVDYLTGTQKHGSAFSKNEEISGERAYGYKDFGNVFSAFDVSPQNKMFRLDFINSNKLRFSATRTSNDLFFTEAARITAEKIVFVTEDLVTIRRNYNSSSLSSTRAKTSEDIVTVLKELYSYIKKIGLSTSLCESFTSFSCKHIKYGAQRGYNESFFRAVTDWLKEEPWDCVSKEDFFKKLNFCAFHSELVKSRLKAQIEEADDLAVCALRTKLKERENNEHAMKIFLDAFFDGDKALLEKCEAELIKTEFEKAYIGAYRKGSEMKRKNSDLSKKNKALKEKNKNLKEKNKSLKEEINKIKSSPCYKLLRLITFIPRKIKGKFRR